MSTASPFVIVVGIDFSDSSDRALDQALEAASLHDRAEVHAVYIEPEGYASLAPPDPLTAFVSADEALQRLQEHVSDRMRAMGGKLDGRRLKRVVVHFGRGSAAEGIAQLAADLDADLVVVGSHGRRGLERILLGSVAERAARLSRCPVWIIRPKDHATAGRVPQIEPPCPECVNRRKATGGSELWCERHAEQHVRPHRYAYVGDGLHAVETQAYEATPNCD